MTRTGQAGGFTLVELLVVVCLVALAAGLVTFRLDGLTDTGALRSSANQIGAVLRLTAMDARLSGSPRMLSVDAETASISVARPEWQSGEAVWQRYQSHDLPRSVHVDATLIRSGELDQSPAIRIGSSGRHTGFAVLLRSHARWAVAWFPNGRPPHWEMLERAPLARTYDELASELAEQP